MSKPTLPADALHERMNEGRASSFVHTYVKDIVTEMTDQIMSNAVSAHRAGELSGERALVAWGKVDAIWGLLDTLENRIQLGEAAATELQTGQR